MLKLIGGGLIGIFIGALLFEVVKRQKPELVEAIENNAKIATDRLFGSLQEAYDFRQIEA